MRFLGRLLLHVVVLSTPLLASIQVAYAAITITVSPANPTTDDFVRVMVSEKFPDGCWTVVDFPPRCSWGDHTLIASCTVADSWTPDGCSCGSFGGGSYCALICYTPLAAGTWTINYNEHHQSLRGPCGDNVTVQFTVEGTSPVAPLTWGGIKRLYGSSSR